MATKHTATSKITGETFNRTSRDRVYSHCVIVHFKTRPADLGHFNAYYHKERPAHRVCGGWSSTLELAQKNARSWKRSDIEQVEIVEAVRS